MDLGAYVQIEDLEEVAKKNGIEIPRLRGYRLMKDEVPVDINETIEDYNVELETCIELCESTPSWSLNPHYLSLDEYTDYKKDYFMHYTKDKRGNHKYDYIRWDRIHGKKRKILKFKIKNQRKQLEKQYSTWNKYCGRDDILYVHARIGGNNWKFFGGDELMEKEWFLEKVDDYWDSTYCDIYCKIKPEVEA